MRLVLKYHGNACSEVKDEIVEKIERGDRLSVTADEWTSVASRRYFNINLHGTGGYVRNLGLVRILGSFTSERTLECCREHLLKFGVNMENHCVASTADGASVMVKFGKLAPTQYQGCYAHALHLAVGDVLYKKTAGTGEVELEQESDTEDDEDDQTDLDEDEGDIMFEEAPVLNDNIRGIIKNVRKDVKRFRKSPLDDEVLQKHVREMQTRQKHKQKELKMILDVRTR